jgi:hypothetical protein
MSERPSEGRRERIRTLRRRILLALSGQILLQRNRVSGKARRLLWYYDWSTLGDSIMDLSQRAAIPEEITLDLLMPCGPAGIFAGDSRFAHVFRSIEEVGRDYDFILIQDLSTRSLKYKLSHHFATPFASVHEHLKDERFSRIAFAARRISELFGLPPFPPLTPSLPMPAQQSSAAGRVIAVAIGGNDPRRAYQDWAGVLGKLIANWPAEERAPRFLLIGNGAGAVQALQLMPAALLADHCDTLIDAGDPRELVAAIAGCDAFLGADGGLMHIAAACGKPGLALFCEIQPEWRLHPDCRLASLCDDSSLNRITAGQIAGELIAQLFPGANSL